MQVITPEFTRRAVGAASAASGQSRAQESAQGEGMDHFTLEMTDSPFQSVLRTLEHLKDTNPKEAMRLLKNVLSDKLFTSDIELSRLSTKMDEITEELRKRKPEEAFEAPVALNAAFTRGMHNMPAPAAAPSGPAFAPAGPGMSMGLAA